MNGVIFIAGVYGVGKSTLCEKISEIINLPFYSASELISEQVGETYGVNKKVFNKDVTQNILLKCIDSKMSEDSAMILAGHFCILSECNEPEKLPFYVYEKMNISLIVLLEATTDEIVRNLKKRDKKTYSREVIDELLITERNYAMKVSEVLKVPMIKYLMSFSEADTENVLAFIEEVYGESYIRY